MCQQSLRNTGIKNICAAKYNILCKHFKSGLKLLLKLNLKIQAFTDLPIH